MHLLNVGRMAAKNLALILLVASIGVIGSERMFWFWSTSVGDHLFVAAYYGIAVVTALWLIAHYRVNSWWSLLLVGPVYGLLVEGVLTPVVFAGGPFVPFFPAYFAFWHGFIALFLLVFVMRSWLLRAAWKHLALLSLGLGVFWGSWSLTLRLPENVNDPELVADMGELTVLGPSAFASYSLMFTAILAASHWLLGYVWPQQFRVSKTSLWLTRAVIVLVLVVWTVMLPWALPMFLAYAWLQHWGLTRHRAQVDGPDLFAQLKGRVPLRNLWPLSFMAAGASATYALLWWLEPTEQAVRGFMHLSIWSHALAGAMISVRALLRYRKPGRDSPASGLPVAAHSGSAAGKL